MKKYIGTRITDKTDPHILEISHFKSEEEFNSAKTHTINQLFKNKQWFTIDDILEEVNT